MEKDTERERHREGREARADTKESGGVDKGWHIEMPR